MPVLDDLVVPSNTTLPPSFYSNEFSITPIHVQLNNAPTPIASPSPKSDPQSLDLGLFQDLHQDHSIETNHDLMYEMLYLATENIPGWSKMPFEVLIQIIEVKQLFGGFSNFLVSFELKEEYLTNPELHSTRPATLVKIIEKVVAQPTYPELLKSFTFQQPPVTKVAVRIYGSAEFADRETELAIAKSASDQGISEVVYASWRHGRIASFLDGLSLGSIKWFDPLLSGSLGYLQGSVHSNNFKKCFDNSTLSLPPLEKPHILYTLSDWCKKSFKTTLYKATLAKIKANGNKPRIGSVFDMFTDPTNALYLINRPACAIKTPVRCNNLILPLPQQLESVILPLLNCYQIDTPETDPRESSYFAFPHRSERTTTIEQLHCVQTGILDIAKDQDLEIPTHFPGEVAQHKTVRHPSGASVPIRNYTVPTPESRLLTQEESELVTEYLDLPKLQKEIDWLLSHCSMFPIVCSHNDYHSGNVLLLNNVDSPAVDESSSIAPEEGPKPTFTPVPKSFDHHAFSYPNESLPWIKVIDWEYGGFNFRGFDCANSSNESWIVYDGSHPGFTLDLPAWISTAYMGKLNYDVLKIDPAQAEELKDVKYPQFEHPALGAMYDQDKMDAVARVWAQKEDPRIGQDIQHILLGSFATKPYVKGASGAPEPAYRPRELTWVQSCLTGFYHATKQKHYQTCPDPENTPIHPFESTTPPQPGFDPSYTLPATLEEWLEDQVPKLLFEIQILQLASQLAWIFWGITFTDGAATLGFGYLEHALARVIAYVAKKEVLIKMGLLESPWGSPKKD